MKITHYYAGGPISGLTKQHAIYARDKDASYAPLVYLQRPKWITSDDVWEKIVAGISLRLPKGFDTNA